MIKKNLLIILLSFTACHGPSKSLPIIGKSPPITSKSPPTNKPLNNPAGAISLINDTFHYTIVNGVLLKRQYPNHIEFDGVVMENNWGNADSILVIMDVKRTKISKLIMMPDSSRFKFKKKQ
jgi:hypothetical protein